MQEFTRLEQGDQTTTQEGGDACEQKVNATTNSLLPQVNVFKMLLKLGLVLGGVNFWLWHWQQLSKTLGMAPAGILSFMSVVAGFNFSAITNLINARSMQQESNERGIETVMRNLQEESQLVNTILVTPPPPSTHPLYNVGYFSDGENEEEYGIGDEDEDQDQAVFELD